MLNIDCVPAFTTNYLWVIYGRTAGAVVVDPGDADPILNRLNELDLECKAILITHHHADHIGGIDQIIEKFPNVEVYGPVDSRISQVTCVVKDGDKFDLDFLPASFRVMEVPGHTKSHIAYYTETDGCKLFCGDTLFACGCGRLFEGSGEQMHHSLTKIKQLPSTTEVYCAHEYTLDNIAFAKWVEPENLALLQREKHTQDLRNRGQPSVPTSLALELETNPFLRSDCQSVVDAASLHAGRPLQQGAEVFSHIREWKDLEFD